jgi:hypothetical protein
LLRSDIDKALYGSYEKLEEPFAQILYDFEQRLAKLEKPAAPKAKLKAAK